MLEEAGWEAVHARAAAQAATLAGGARGARPRGRAARPRPRSSSWADPDAEATRDRLAAAGVAVRNLPGRGLVRASVGAWNDENDLDRLLGALG